jgi:glutamate 5-kinase
VARRVVVVKVGSSTLVTPTGLPRSRVFSQVARDAATLREGGTPVVIVSSGAIALGLGVLGRRRRPERLADLQAASALGQSLLQRRWERALARFGATAAQVLLTAGDIHRRDSYVNARRTLDTLVGWGAVPVVNENDSVATDEIAFGDNDALAAQVAVLVRARLLVLLTDIAGLYDRNPADPDARLIREVSGHVPRDRLELGARGSPWGAGGMRSKLVAAEMASAGGVETVIAAGRTAGMVAAAAAGRPVGTHFTPSPSPLSAYKLWLRYGKPVQGRLKVDDGARRAVAGAGTSLLPVGVVDVDGEFAAGDAVHLVGPDGEAFAVGLAEYPAGELRGLAGARGVAEAVHRDNLVLL